MTTFSQAGFIDQRNFGSGSTTTMPVTNQQLSDFQNDYMVKFITLLEGAGLVLDTTLGPLAYNRDWSTNPNVHTDPGGTTTQSLLLGDTANGFFRWYRLPGTRHATEPSWVRVGFNYRRYVAGTTVSVQMSPIMTVTNTPPSKMGNPTTSGPVEGYNLSYTYQSLANTLVDKAASPITYIACSLDDYFFFYLGASSDRPAGWFSAERARTPTGDIPDAFKRGTGIWNTSYNGSTSLQNFTGYMLQYAPINIDQVRSFPFPDPLPNMAVSATSMAVDGDIYLIPSVWWAPGYVGGQNVIQYNTGTLSANVNVTLPLRWDGASATFRTIASGTTFTLNNCHPAFRFE